MIERIFRLKANGTSVSRECLAGLTTFAAMAYILAVNPALLSETGMDAGALVTATGLAAAVGCLLMAFLTNYPIALAPGMGLNAFFTYGICLGAGIPWQGALAMVFWTGILFCLLSVTGWRKAVVGALPEALKIGIQAGIGLFIAFIGLQNAGIVVAHPATLVDLGSFTEAGRPTPAGLTFIGLLLATVLLIKHIPGAVLLAIIFVATIGLWVPNGEDSTITQVPDSVVGWPQSLASLWMQLDWFYPFRHWETAWVLMLSLLFVDLFDSVGTLIGVSRQAQLTDSQGDLPKMSHALLADAAATSTGACLGCSPVTSYIESATGVEAGGRTGLTSIVVALCFILALFFHPLILALPPAATAPALILVGILMLSQLSQLSWEDRRSSLPGAATALLMPFAFSIADGIALGCVAYTAIMILTGEYRRVPVLLHVLSLLFLLKLVFVG